MLTVIRRLDNDGWYIYGMLQPGTPAPIDWEAIATCATPAQAQRIAAEYGRSEEAWARLG